MWIYLTLISAVLLGVYDVCKKKSLRRNSVMWVLFSTSVLSTVMLTPFFTKGPAHDLFILVPKAALVTISWISGLAGMKMLPMTIASTLKASRPVFVIILSMLIFGERLSPMQWTGIALALAALFLLSRSSRREGIVFHRNKGILWMCIAIAAGVASAVYDKYVISSLHLGPMFVECWCNLMIAILMGLVLGFRILKDKACGIAHEHFRWDPFLLLTSLLIIGADTAYFFALADEGALLSVISLMRRGSVIVTFILSALVFKETNLRSKALELSLLLAGISILALC